MSKNQVTLVSNKREQWVRFGLIALAIAIFCSMMMTSGVLPALAAGAGGMNNANGSLEKVMGLIVNIITSAAKYIGGAIVIWGVFQMVLSFRREDSEGISKQITTVVVGSILVGLGLFAKDLLNMLGVKIS